MKIEDITFTLRELLAEAGTDGETILRVAKYAAVERQDWDAASRIREMEKSLQTLCSPKTG